MSRMGAQYGASCLQRAPVTSVIAARVYTDYATAMNSDTRVSVRMASLDHTVIKV